MPTRELTAGEHNVIAHALFELQDKRRTEAYRFRQATAPYKDDARENPRLAALVEQAENLERESKQAFNLELLIRRYTLSLTAPLHIGDQA